MLVDFKHDAAQMKLEIAAQPEWPDVDGYLELLKLPVRYAGPAVWAQFHRRHEALVSPCRASGSRVWPHWMTMS